jgi:hypothetical protein
VGLWQRIGSWWNKGDLDAATEDARDNDQAQRDRDAEDFEGRRDDLQARSDILAGGAADYERDSEPPRDLSP